MIHRRQPDGSLIVVTQLAHAWLSGQFAERWGGAEFRLPEPQAGLVLAAFRHDDGWAEWEAAPRLRPDGRVPAFGEMHIDDHLAIWRRGLRVTEAVSPFVALLVALHATALYRRRLAGGTDPEAVRAKIESFQAETEAQILAWIEELGPHAQYGPHLPVGTAPADYLPLHLLQLWDLLSLLVCGGLTEARDIPDVPGLGGPVTLRIAPVPQSGAVERFTLSPWPFDRPAFTAQVDARRLPRDTFADDAELQAALAGTAWVPLVFNFSE